MSQGRTVRAATDLMPLADRLRALAAWRSVVLTISLAAVVCAPTFSTIPRWPVVGGVAAFLVISGGLTVRALRRNEGVQTLVRVLLLGDSVAIVLLSLGVGGPGSPLRYLVILQAVEVTLLASFRTGLRLVVWQTFLVSALYVIGPIVAADLSTVFLDEESVLEIVGLLGCSWIAAITTAALAATNERELRRRRHDLEQLADYHGTISEISDIAAVTDEFARRAADEFAIAKVLVALPELSGRLRVRATFGIEAPPPALVMAPGSLLADAASSTSTLLVLGLDPDTDAELLPLFGADARIAALAVRTPIGRGVVLVEPQWANEDRVERRVVSMLGRYRDELESRVSNLVLIDSLRTAATTDALTGVANRGRLREALHAATQQASRQHQPLCVAMLDVDHFKKVNDVHGHAAGDEVLRQVAAIMVGSVRPYDIVARYGGEEFVVLFSGTDLDEASVICERLRSAVEMNTAPVAVTISLGLARFDPAVDDDDQVIARADALLYEAKQSGRNRLRVADQALLPRPSPLPPPAGLPAC